MNTPQLEDSVPLLRRRWVKPLLVVLMLVIGTVTWLGAQSVQGGKIGASSANPAYIVVSTSTPVTFTTVISDSSLRKHDSLKVLLVRVDASGKPIDIVARTRDDGRRADGTRRDRTYTARITLKEPTVGSIYFKVAARFNGGKDDDDWDRDLGSLNDSRNRSRRPSQLTLLLRKLQKYELSDSIVVTVDPFLLPPDPGEAGKQTLEGIDSDHDGVRDDVQRWIGLNVSGVGDLLATTKYAVAIQSQISRSSSAGETRAEVERMFQAWNCLRSLRSDAMADATLDELDLILVNTSSRNLAIEEADRYMSGQLLPELVTGGQPAACAQ